MENIRISEETYVMFLNKYEELHEHILRDIAYCEDRLRELSHRESGFYATQTSETIEEILEVWDETVKAHLEEGFHKMEQSIRNYLDSMQEADNI